MKILVTGAYGFVGTNLCRHLVEKGNECHALDVPAARRSDLPYAAFHVWDELDKLPDFDAVVHLAGKAHDLKKVSSARSYYDVNVGLMQKIFRAVQGKVGRFIYFSSSKAADAEKMGECSNERFDELLKTHPDVTPYALSKYLAERYLLSFKPETLNFKPIILRPAMIHGPGNKGNLNLLWGIARRGFPWPLAAFENRRSFTAIGNVCAAVAELCARGEGGVYPIADDEMVSTNRLIELMAETCGRKAHLWRLPKGLMRLAARVGDFLPLPLNTERLGKLTEDSFVDNSLLKKALGWDWMPIRAEDGFRTTLETFKV